MRLYLSLWVLAIASARGSHGAPFVQAKGQPVSEHCRYCKFRIVCGTGLGLAASHCLDKAFPISFLFSQRTAIAVFPISLFCNVTSDTLQGICCSQKCFMSYFCWHERENAVQTEGRLITSDNAINHQLAARGLPPNVLFRITLLLEVITIGPLVIWALTHPSNDDEKDDEDDDEDDDIFNME